jgi:hypothetical protein
MTDPTKLTATETDLALISFARVVLDVLFAADLVRPNEINPLLEIHQKNMEQMKYPTAAGILGSIRVLANDPQREQMRENLRKLIRERPKGSA